MVELNNFNGVVYFQNENRNNKHRLTDEPSRKKIKLVKQLKMSAIINDKIKRKKKQRNIYEIRDLSIEAFKYGINRTTKHCWVDDLAPSATCLKQAHFTSTQGSLTSYKKEELNQQIQQRR